MIVNGIKMLVRYASGFRQGVGRAESCCRLIIYFGLCISWLSVAPDPQLINAPSEIASWAGSRLYQSSESTALMTSLKSVDNQFFHGDIVVRKGGDTGDQYVVLVIWI